MARSVFFSAKPRLLQSAAEMRDAVASSGLPCVRCRILRQRPVILSLDELIQHRRVQLRRAPARVWLWSERIRANGVFGNASTGFEPHDFNSVQVTTAPPGGPNAGLSFVRDPLPQVPHIIYMHPALYGSLPAPAVHWFNDQNGLGSGNCTLTHVTGILRPEAERHEGVTMAIPNSHWALTRDFYASAEQPHQRIEALYAYGPAPVLQSYLWAAWVKLHNTGTHRANQDAFEATDYPLINSALGCTLDHNISDN